MNAAADPFDETRRKLLPAALETAVFDGFTPLMMRAAAQKAGLSRSELAAAFPHGAVDLAAFWSQEADRAAAEALRAGDAQGLKIREKVALGIETRLAYLRPHKEAARRAAAYFALPHNALAGARLVWRTADSIWRAIGDRSTDFNYYSKRAILAGVWSSTFMRWLADDGADEAATKAFLNDRIANVMQFEKFKSKVRDSGFDPEGMFGWLARLRYPDKR
jgi:ubiquinone biosynthesis protein COQ9